MPIIICGIFLIAITVYLFIDKNIELGIISGLLGVALILFGGLFFNWLSLSDPNVNDGPNAFKVVATALAKPTSLPTGSGLGSISSVEGFVMIKLASGVEGRFRAKFSNPKVNVSGSISNDGKSWCFVESLPVSGSSLGNLRALYDQGGLVKDGSDMGQCVAGLAYGNDGRVAKR